MSVHFLLTVLLIFYLMWMMLDFPCILEIKIDQNSRQLQQTSRRRQKAQRMTGQPCYLQNEKIIQIQNQFNTDQLFSQLLRGS